MISFAHSYWTGPIDGERQGYDSSRRWISHLYCFALSATYIKKLGYDINLYADEKTLKMFKDFPYSKFIEVDLSNTANPEFWAQSKFYALKKMDLGEIHIDGDVFIKHPDFMKLIDLESDVNFQSFEAGNMIMSESCQLSRDFMKDIDFGDVFKPSEVMPICNTGVIQINNQELKDKYINNYFSSIDKMDKAGITKNMSRKINPDIILEQLSLHQICNYYNYKLNPIFNTTAGPYLKVNEYMYVHLISDKKYIMLPLVKKWLQELNPSLYEKLLPIEKEILGCSD